MQAIILTLAAALLVATMLVHSILGQRRLIQPLLEENGGIMERPLARFIVPFAWHLTSFIGMIVATVLFAWAWMPEHARTIGLAGTGIVFTAGGIWDAIGSRGRHVGWPPLTLIGLLALIALATN
jgi:hypothetical protein